MARIDSSDPSKRTGGSSGPHPKKTEVSREVKATSDKTSPLRSSIPVDRGHAKISGFSKGPANKAEDKKVAKAWKRQIGA